MKKLLFKLLALTAFFGTSGVSATDNYAHYLAALKAQGKPEREWTINRPRPPQQFFQYRAENVVVLFDASGSTGYYMGCAGLEYETKHVSLAQFEALCLVFAYLAQSQMDHSSLFLSSFSGTIAFPNIGFPHNVVRASEYAKIADNLEHILPRPEEGCTYLAPNLKRLIGMEQPLTCSCQDTLVIIVTDGEVSDASETGKYLNDLSRHLSVNGKRLDMLVIGAGSLGSKVEDLSTLFGNAMSLIDRADERGQKLCATTQVQDGKCKTEYLASLVNFKSVPFGRGIFAGAYDHYEDLNRALFGFFSGQKDGSKVFYIQADTPNTFMRAEPFQHYALAKYFNQNEDNLTINEQGHCLTIGKAPNGEIFQVDQSGVGRYFFSALKSDIMEHDLGRGLCGLSFVANPAVRITGCCGTVPIVATHFDMLGAGLSQMRMGE